MPRAMNNRLACALALAAAAISAAVFACFDLSTPYHDALAMNTYLVATVGPCAPIPGADIDPCERRLDNWKERQTPYNTGHTHMRERGPHTVETSIAFAFGTPYRMPHQFVRGFVLPGSTRCEEHDASLGGEFSGEPQVYEWMGDTCFSELKVQEYIVGSGPPIIPVIVGWHHKILDKGHPSGDRYYEWVEGIHSVREASEWVVALHVPFDFTYAAWRTWSFTWWDLQRRDDGTLVVVDYQARYHPRIQGEGNGYEITLDEFRTLARRMHADYVLAHGGRIGDFDGAPPILNDANYEFLLAHMSKSPVFDIVDATPRSAPPPP